MDKHLATFVVVEILFALLMLIFGTGLPYTRPRFTLGVDRENPRTITVCHLQYVFITKINPFLSSYLQDDGVTVNYLSVNCFSPLSFLWIGVLIMFYVPQHAFAIFIAVKIRNVKIRVLNEYREVSTTIYISTIAVLEGLAFSVILQDFETIVESFSSASIIVVATTYIGFTFIPKVGL